MSETAGLLTLTDLLRHWQGHRELTRRVIEAFPEQDFEQYHAPDMRPFRDLACELAGMVDYQLQWLRQGQPHWEEGERRLPPRADLLEWWDRQTGELNDLLPGVSRERWLTEVATPFGSMSPLTSVLYLIDNENHHRGQGYVYLRELGIQPPAFYERSSLPDLADNA